MKKLFTVLFVLFALGASQKIEAKGVIVYHDGPTFKTIKELPQDQTIEGKHVNLGIAFEQFGLFWLPLWNYGDVKYALVTDNEEEAWEIDEETLAELKSEFNLDIADTPSIPFWHKVGLKPVVILLLILIIWGYIPSKKRRES